MKHGPILLFYEKNHLKQPFIKLLIEYLASSQNERPVITVSFASDKQVGSRAFSSLNNWLNSKVDGPGAFERAYGARGPSLKLIKSAIKIFRQHEPDTIITFLPIGFISSQIYRRMRSCRVVYFPFEIYGEQHSAFSRQVILYEKLAFLLKPDTFITQNEYRANYYKRHRFCRTAPFIAHNYKERPRVGSRDPAVFEKHGLPGHLKIVLYQGMLTAGRWLDRLLLASQYLRQDAVLVLMGPKQQPWWDETIKPLIEDLTNPERVCVLESVPHELVSQYAAAASLGVIIYDDSVLNNVYCEPGKIGDFVHAGVPVIAPGFPSIRFVIERYRLGSTFEDYSCQGIAQAINDALELPQEHYKQALATAAETMSWEKQWPSLMSALLG
jgi:glycosyltransferase involved in cell wall biosynthesis